MSIFIISPNRDPKDWIESFKTQAPDIAVHTNLDAGNPKDIQHALVWNHQHGALQAFPNLKLISSMGAGVDHIFADDKRPQVPVARVTGEALTVSMSQYILAAVLQYQRKFKEYAQDQAAQMWNQERGEHSQIKVGILGMGSLGLDAAMKLDQIGIEVIGYGRSAKSKTVVPYYHGDQLEEFLGQINVLVCLLPLTEETKDILNINLFRKCQPGTYLINVAKGLRLVETDFEMDLEKSPWKLIIHFGGIHKSTLRHISPV